MAYNQEAPQASPSTSLLSDGSNITSRLTVIRNRLTKVGNTLHGPNPAPAREAGLPANPLESESTLRRTLDRAQAAITGIEDEITRIEARL